jgi:uncharacterized glyoxalase superfamily protein PhnB
MHDSYPALTPYLTSQRAAELVDFVKAAFGAKELYRGTGSAGGLHAEVMIGNATLMIGGGPSLPASQERRTGLHLYVPDADSVYRQAVAAGATSRREPVDQDYGDREASVIDLAGNPWYIATHRLPANGSYMPDGLRSVTPFLHTHGAAGLIEFLKKAFGAEEVSRSQSPAGTIHHALIRIGDSALELSEAHGEHQPLPTMFYLYGKNADATYRLALEAGATPTEEPADQDYGHRRAAVKDAYNNLWYMASSPTGKAH